ncbi:hypothetical protein Q5752_001462 [Cryptotrichosporon argae]
MPSDDRSSSDHRATPIVAAATLEPSPVLSYSPCRSCLASQGFEQGAAYFSLAGNGTDSGFTTAAGGTASLNVTGTAVAFDLRFSNNTAWSTAVRVNQTVHAGAAGVEGLPYGTHEVELRLTREAAGNGNGGATAWVTLEGVRVGLGVAMGPESTNQTIDDTAWRDGAVQLTPGWNMLERAASNWINTTEYDAELPTATHDFNASVSWTEAAGGATTVDFSGEAVWAYGIVGGEAGTFEVLLDNATRGVFDATAPARVYQQVLYHASGLGAGAHTLELRRLSGRLSFDRLVALGNLTAVAATASSVSPSAPSSTAAASSSASAAAAASTASGLSSDGLATPLVACVSVLGALVGLALVVGALVAFCAPRWRDRTRSSSGAAAGYGSGRRDERDRPFVVLEEPSKRRRAGLRFMDMFRDPAGTSATSKTKTKTGALDASTLGRSALDMSEKTRGLSPTSAWRAGTAFALGPPPRRAGARGQKKQTQYPVLVRGRTISSPRPVDGSADSSDADAAAAPARPPLVAKMSSSTLPSPSGSAMDHAVRGTASPLSALQRQLSFSDSGHGRGGTGAWAAAESSSASVRTDAEERLYDDNADDNADADARRSRETFGILDAYAYAHDSASGEDAIGLAISTDTPRAPTADGRGPAGVVTPWGAAARRTAELDAHAQSRARAAVTAPMSAAGPGASGGGGVEGGFLGDALIPPREPERSPRRRFFGRAAHGDRDSVGSSTSGKTAKSAGSAWVYM